MSFVLGLTGSIGMGKSTTAEMFRKHGVPVWDADAVVHNLYARGGAAVEQMSELVPQAILNGAIDRAVLRQEIAKDAELIGRIESIIHPLIAQDRKTFQEVHQHFDLIVLDIPLLFETGADANCDATVVVSTHPEEQRRRVLARGMSSEMFETLLSRQMSDADKRARATYVVPTHTLAEAEAAVHALIRDLTKDQK